MSKKVFRIGLPSTQFERRGELLTRQNLFEFDLIIWEPRSLLLEIGEDATNAHENISGSLSEEFGMDLEIKVARRTDEILEFVHSGRDLIVFGAKLPILNYRFDRTATVPIDLGSVGGLGEITWKDNHGRVVEWVGPPSIIQDFPILATSLAYSAMCEPREHFVPLYKVPNSEGVVGGYIKQSNTRGYIIFVPRTPSWDDFSSKPFAIKNAYLNALAALPDALRALQSSRVKLPAWSNTFVLPEEKTALQEIATHENNIKEIETKITVYQNLVIEEREWKYLFTAFDDHLVGAVLRALNYLGIKAVRGPKNHADIIACLDGRLAALEVKGKTGSAARKDAEQCKTWVSELMTAQLSEADERKNDTVTKGYLKCLNELDVSVCDPGDPNAQPIEVKGVLLINAYRDLPLDQRTEPDFPHPMLRTIIGGSLCALTALQLLGMVLKARKISSDRDRLAQLLFDHTGAVDEYTNWKEFLLT
jgi:hypothetical protein